MIFLIAARLETESLNSDKNFDLPEPLAPRITFILRNVNSKLLYRAELCFILYLLLNSFFTGSRAHT